MILIKNEAVMRNTQSRHWYPRYAIIAVAALVGLILSFSGFFPIRTEIVSPSYIWSTTLVSQPWNYHLATAPETT